MTLLSTLFLALLLPLAAADGPDEIVTVKGKTYEGRIVFQDAEKVVLRVKTRDREFAREDIAEIRSLTRSLGDVLDRVAQLADDDIPGLLTLADEAINAGLSQEARLLRLRALLLDPNSTEANEALGNRDTKKGWKYKRGSKLVETVDLATIGLTWKNRWELDTTHFIVESNLALWDGIVACLDLEHTYRVWYDLVGEGVKIYDVTEIMEVHAHGDSGSYPEPGDGRPGFYDEGERVLSMLSEDGPPGGILAHEAVHQFFFMTAVRERGMAGQIPQWLNEGLAVYFQESAERVNGFLAYELGRPAQRRFKDHVDAPKRFELRRILTMDQGDFMASTHTAAKYGQAYTLVHFLLHGTEGRYREMFFDILQRAYDGQGSMSDFKKALEDREKEWDLDMDDFEKVWHAYAEEMAG